jgi:alpha-amylase/alpha-mannosidase (GH57 family)
MVRRMDDPKDVYLVVHGHFYQPPRENPWLEAIEREPSAAPFPNWNARIAHECYRQNAAARIFEDRGRVVEILNNYIHFSFNFGPTLLSWLEVQMPDVYRRILEADRFSVGERSGHGNALAQGYGHAILPLCNDRDRLTQIRWGKRDFSFRFGRGPEAMWLPEAAIDAATVEDLIAEGMRFVVLSPKQARRVRPLQAPDEPMPAQDPYESSTDEAPPEAPPPASPWRDVGPDRVDPRMPYRCFSRRDPERYIDVFFYDGPVAHGISFERVLDSSKQLVDKLWGAVDAGRDGPQLVHAAVDGETFGHHMRHAERALSYAFRVEAPRRGFTLTNYGEYLERHPPTHEVELEFGPDGEGSSWSCAHGVGRWYRDCSCHASAPEGWNQAWRGPLRQAVNLVRDEAARLYEELGGDLLQDVWAARDAYVELLLDTGVQARERFLDTHGRSRARGMSGQLTALKLLEMQRHSLLAQTSCGWFFNDISGLEAVQVLKYAARTVQLIEELSGRDVEGPLLEVLGEARSNLEEQGTGADVWRRHVLPATVGINRLVAQYAITDRFRRYPNNHQFYGYQVNRVEGRRLSGGSVSVSVGRLQVEFLSTGETRDVSYALIHFGGHDFHCAVRPFAGVQEFRRLIDQLESIIGHATVTELLRVVDAHFGEDYYTLRHLLAEEREEVLDSLFGHITERFAEMYTRLYRENRRAVNALIETGFKPPEEFRMAAEYVLSRQLNEEIRAQLKSRDRNRYQTALSVVREARARDYNLDKRSSAAVFNEMLNESIEGLVAEPTPDASRQALEVVELADLLQIELELQPAQDMLFRLLEDRSEGAPWRACAGELPGLLDRLRMAPSLVPDGD